MKTTKKKKKTIKPTVVKWPQYWRSEAWFDKTLVAKFENETDKNTWLGINCGYSTMFYTLDELQHQYSSHHTKPLVPLTLKQTLKITGGLS